MDLTPEEIKVLKEISCDWYKECFGITPEEASKILDTFAEMPTVNPVTPEALKEAFFRIDYNKPDRNGRIYTKESVEKAWREYINDKSR